MQVQGAFSPGGAQSQEVAPADEAPVPAAPVGSEPVEAPPSELRPLATPPVRKLAKELGIDLREVAPSREDGVITRADVEAYASSARLPESYEDLPRPGVAPLRGAREVREPIKGVRKQMAAAMSASAFTSPHVTEWITVDCTATMRLVERLREHPDFAGVKVSPLLVLARACLLAMRRTPVVNSYWDSQAQEVVLKGYVNLGVAAATPRGLVVRELAEALGELTATARQGRTQPADMAGGTFTITNVGVFGVDAGTPIINPGESAILAFGAVNRRPWVVGSGADERLEIRDVTTLALSFDHRHIDGAAGSRYLADVAGVLADPATALLF
jgi:pyruvate dehydrogenase E2 component (dihydrolipoamide acetyltransferase)